MRCRNLFLWLVIVFAFTTALAQDTQYHPAPKINIDSVEQAGAVGPEALSGRKDMVDWLHGIAHAKPGARRDLSAYHLSFVPAAGYSLQTGLAGVLSANLGFYTGARHDDADKISSILTSVTYSQYRQIIFPIQADIWTKNSKYNIIVDWRYLAYPSTTFGLGGHSDINNGYTINFNYIKLHQAILAKVLPNLYAGVGFFYDYFWNVQQVNPPAGETTDFERYGFTKTVTAAGPAFRLLVDTRKNQIAPNGGWFGNVVYRPNLTVMGSDNNWQSLLLEMRKYIPVSASKRNVLAIWSYNWLTLGGGKPPYLLLPSTGWDDFYNTGRGYIQGRYRGRDMLYLETEYRFDVTHNGLLGAVVFANAQSFSRELSKQLSVIAPGTGVGLRLRINKFSGANLCIDYGFGTEGSRGIFVNLGEVF
ncbi:MAG TPA: hypothetical protein VLD19_22025 [Chitinophagaceae bacterium]|nr:hypothetical protein [Chitinophagaceae bacterium]